MHKTKNKPTKGGEKDVWDIFVPLFNKRGLFCCTHFLFYHCIKEVLKLISDSKTSLSLTDTQRKNHNNNNKVRSLKARKMFLAYLQVQKRHYGEGDTRKGLHCYLK